MTCITLDALGRNRRDKPPTTIKGRKIAVLAGNGVDAHALQAALDAPGKAGLVPETIGPATGTVAPSDKAMTVNRTAPNAPSVVYDAVLMPPGIGAARAAMPLARRFRARGLP